MNNINYKDWFNKNAKMYSKSMNKSTIFYRAEFIKEHAKGRVLAVGIGDGQAASLYQKSKIIKEIIGLDFADNMLKECRNKLNIKLIKGNIETLKLKENSFDTIVCSEVIYYLRNPEKFIAKCKKILRKNGKIIIIIFNPSLYFIEFIREKLKLTLKENINTLSISKIKNFLLKNRFRNISINYFCAIPLKKFKFIDKIFLNKFGFKIGITAIK